MRPSEKLREKRAEVLEIFSRYPLISNPRVFGSVARGEDREDSDLDLLVDVSRGTTIFHICDLQEEISALLDLKVDILTSTATMNDRLRNRVFAEARTL